MLLQMELFHSLLLSDVEVLLILAKTHNGSQFSFYVTDQ